MKLAVFVIFALVLTYLGFTLSDQSKWVETSAVVTEAIVREDHSGRNRHGIFTPFYIDGQIEYTSPKGKHVFKINNLRNGIVDRESADDEAKKLLGSKMPIKYDPNKPSSWVTLLK